MPASEEDVSIAIKDKNVQVSRDGRSHTFVYTNVSIAMFMSNISSIEKRF